MPGPYTVARALDDHALLAGDDAAWSRAARITWGDPPYATAFRGAWTTSALHLRFDVSDVEPWHTLTARDGNLWTEEVVEIFLDPAGTGHDYAELEISHANNVCDLIVRTPWPQLSSDPRWHLEGLETKVHAWPDAEAGPGGWTATARVPWSAFTRLPYPVSLPPASGDSWAFNVYRIKRPHGPARPEDGVVYLTAWSPTGGPSFHVPSVFQPFRFA